MFFCSHSTSSKEINMTDCVHLIQMSNSQILLPAVYTSIFQHTSKKIYVLYTNVRRLANSLLQQSYCNHHQPLSVLETICILHILLKTCLNLQTWHLYTNSSLYIYGYYITIHIVNMPSNDNLARRRVMSLTYRLIQWHKLP